MRSKRGPQKFSEEFRREAVRLVRESDKSVKALGAELGVSETTLRHWLRAIPAGKQTAPGRVLSLEEEVRKLKQENERLREEREILKKATPSSPGRGDEIRLHPSARPPLARHHDVPGAGGVEGRLLRVACAPPL